MTWKVIEIHSVKKCQNFTQKQYQTVDMLPNSQLRSYNASLEEKYIKLRRKYTC